MPMRIRFDILFSNVDEMVWLDDGSDCRLGGVLLVRTHHHTASNSYLLCTSTIGTKLPSAVYSRESWLVILHRNHPKRIQSVQYRHDICPKPPATEAGGAFVPIVQISHASMHHQGQSDHAQLGM
jgi:hypothetical protein